MQKTPIGTAMTYRGFLLIKFWCRYKRTAGTERRLPVYIIGLELIAVNLSFEGLYGLIMVDYTKNTFMFQCIVVIYTCSRP